MTFVVKIGGAAGNDAAPVLADLARRSDYVVVHGGSEEVDRLGEAMGRPSRYYTSPSGVVSRHTDPAHLEVVVLALAGKVQTELVRAFGALGVRAVGLSGVDGGLLRAEAKQGARAVENGRILHVKDDRSGVVREVRAELLTTLLRAGYVPVVGPPAVSNDGTILNVDADRAAAEIAIALGASELLLLTNVPGLLRDPKEPSSLVAHVERADLSSALGLAKGRMRKKVLAAEAALKGGVGRVVIGRSGGPEPVGAALAGAGTVFS